MVEINSKEMRNWLRGLGLTETHIDYLIKTSERDKAINEKSLSLVRSNIEYSFNGVDYVMTWKGALRKKTLEDWYSEFHSKDEIIISAHEEYRQAKKDISEKMSLIDISRIINPFLNEDELEIDVYFYIHAIVEGELPVFLYPWQNRYLIFSGECRPDGKVDNRLYYADLNKDCQEYAMIHVSDYVESSLKYPQKIPFGDGRVEVWKSYLPLYANSIEIKSRTIRPSTLARYKKWHERLLEIKHECERKGEKFSENNAHEQIAGEEKRDTSTIDKGIRAYLATLESSEISENS